MSTVLVLQRDIPKWLPHFGPGARWRFSQRTYCGGLLFLTVSNASRVRRFNHILHIFLCTCYMLHHPLILFCPTISDFFFLNCAARFMVLKAAEKRH